MASKNLFMATVAVFLVAGCALGAFWAYNLAGPIVVAPYAPMVTTTVTAGSVQTQTSASEPPPSATTAATSAAGTGVPKVTVDLTAMTTGVREGDVVNVIIYLTVTNPSESTITLTTIKYDVWINNVYVAAGELGQEAPSVLGNSQVDVRTVMKADLSKLPKDVVDALTAPEALGGGGTLRIKGTLQIRDGFGTADIPFEGEGQIGLPIAT